MHWITCIEGGPRRVNHAAAAVDQLIYTFGGYCMEEDSKGNIPMDVHVLNTRTLRWITINSCKGKESDIPFRRYGHTAVAYEGKIYIWGGRNNEEACNTLFCFDPETYTWSRPWVTGAKPGARDGHSACISAKYMYIFGGFEEVLDSLSNSVCVLDLEGMHWTPLKTSGIPPSPRDFHTAIILNESMYVFGGRSDNRSNYRFEEEWYCNDMFYLDLKSSAWLCLKNMHDKPIGRRSHSVFVCRNNMYIFGGYNGCYGDHFNDLYEFNVELNKWTLIFTYGVSPCKRKRQVCIVIDERLFLFGGTSPSPNGSKMPPTHADYLNEFMFVNKRTDHSDLHILDFTPSLKTFALLAVRKYKLDSRELPKTLQLECKILNSDSSETTKSYT